MYELTAEQVTWMYRLLLGREPESPEIIKIWRNSYKNTKGLCWALILSEEFQDRNSELQISVSGANGLPLPSSRLIHLVAGNPGLHWFLEGGALGKQAIFRILEKNGFNFDDFSDVLDFGCACGRVIRHLHGHKPKMFGTDYNQELIEWSQNNLGFAEFSTNMLAPPTAYADQQFDFIYALSVFTHFPADLQIPWLEEMKRILRPNGLLFLSFHGERYTRQLTEGEKKSYRQGELVVQSEELAGSNTCNAFHPAEYLQSKFGSIMKIVDIVKEGALGNPYQDVLLLQKVE